MCLEREDLAKRVGYTHPLFPPESGFTFLISPPHVAIGSGQFCIRLHFLPINEQAETSMKLRLSIVLRPVPLKQGPIIFLWFGFLNLEVTLYEVSLKLKHSLINTLLISCAREPFQWLSPSCDYESRRHKALHFNFNNSGFRNMHLTLG